MLDFGSGKGRVLIAAMKYGAKKCIGVEFARELIDISKSNLHKYKVSNNYHTDVELVYDNALSYQFSGEEDIIFFYNPFDQTILSELSTKIFQLKTRPLIIYINPIHKKVFETCFKQIDNFDNDMIVYQKPN